MQRIKLLSTVAAAVLLFGTAGASAAATDTLPGSIQLAQSSGSGAGGSGSGAGSSGAGGGSPGAGTGGASDTGPQSDMTEPETGVAPEFTEGDAEPGQGTASPTDTESGTTIGETGDTTPMTEQELGMRSDEIIGQQVVNQQGEEVGEINDLVVDESNQPYAVVGIGGFLGMGEREVAVPVSSLDFGTDQIVYNGMGTVDEFKSMPEYEKGSWRSLQQ